MPSRAKSSKKILLFILIALLLGVFVSLGSLFAPFFKAKEEGLIVKYFPFSRPDSLKEWDEKVLRKRVSYKIESGEDGSYVHAISRNSCSAMHYKINLNPRRHPIFSWKWRVGKFPDKKSPDDFLSKKEDDFAARIYVIFPALFFTNSKVLEYIWAEDLEVGTISRSPYTNNIKLIVVESGLSEEGKWVLEERDIFEDYVLAFGVKPTLKIGNIAFMSDSDSTKSSSEAYFDEIKLSVKK